MTSKFLSNIELAKILELATDEEKLALTKLIDNNQSYQWNAKKLQKEICELGGHSFINLFRGEGTSYLDILDDILNNLEIQNDLPSYYTSNNRFSALCDIDNIELIKQQKNQANEQGIKYAKLAEQRIILQVLEKHYEAMSSSEKAEFDRKVSNFANQFESDPTKSIVTTAGVLTLGNLGGFATYTFLTTVMSGLSFGSLGFGAYTAATSMLSVALGPVGWISLGTFAIYSFGRPKYQKLIPIVIIIGIIRIRLEHIDEQQSEIKQTPKSLALEAARQSGLL